MPSKLYPILLGLAYLLTFIAGGHGAALLIQTLGMHSKDSGDFSQINFLHVLFYLFVCACLVQRQAWLYSLYFLGAVAVAIANPLLGFPRELYFPVTLISQVPLILVSLRFWQLSFRYFEKEGVSWQFSLDDLLKTTVLAGLVAITYKLCLAS
jgi:hypothetical protein